MINSKLDIGVGIISCLIGIALIFYAIPAHVQEGGKFMGGTGSVSPRFFPYFGSATILFGGVLLILNTLILPRGDFQVDAINDLKADTPREDKTCNNNKSVSILVSLKRMTKPLCIALLLSLFIVIYQSLGYFAAACILMVSVMFIFGERRISMLLFHSSTTVIVLYLCLKYGLNYSFN